MVNEQGARDKYLNRSKNCTDNDYLIMSSEGKTLLVIYIMATNYYDENCRQPVHIYTAATILRLQGLTTVSLSRLCMKQQQILANFVCLFRPVPSREKIINIFMLRVTWGLLVA
jgi:hypothetical protein